MCRNRLSPFLGSEFDDCVALTFSTEWVKPTLDRVAYGRATYAQALDPDLKEYFRKWGREILEGEFESKNERDWKWCYIACKQKGNNGLNSI